MIRYNPFLIKQLTNGYFMCYIPDKMRKALIIFVALNLPSVLEGTSAVKCSTEQDCRCIHEGRGQYKADCSGKSLNFVPKFFSNVVAVDLKSVCRRFPYGTFGVGFSELNHLTNLDISGFSGFCDISYMNAEFFQFLPHLERIDISDCKIMRIENGTFRHLNYLTNLDISFNEDLTFRVLSNVSYDLQSTKISVLKANKIYRTFGIGTEVFVKDLEYLQNTELRELYLDSNRMQIIQSGVFERLPKSLIYASLADNKFTMGRYIFEVFAVSNVKILNASFQHISHNPSGLYPPPSKESCDQQVRNLCPEGETSDQIIPGQLFRKSNTSTPIVAPFPPNLETLYFRKCALRYSIPEMNFLSNKIKYCDLSGNILYEWIGPIRYLKKLKHMDLSNNYCSNVSTSFFCCVEQLETLLISDNYVGFVLNKDSEGLTFRRLTKIQEVQPNIFRGLKSLKYLNISNNALRQWTFEIKHMSELKYIDFSNNELTDLAENIRNDLNEMASKQNITLNLKNNNFLCNCDTLDFLKWMTTSKIKFEFFETYRCQKSEANLVEFKNLPEIIRNLNWKCKYKWAIIIGGSVLGSVAVVVSCIAAIYRLRWVIRTWYYLLFIKRNRNRNRGGYKSLDENEAEDMYKYDVFFIYDDEDKRFVWKAVQKLRLQNIRVCFREFDFIIGSSDYKSICFAVKGSRKIVIVVSENLIDSKLCDFQIDLALTESEYRDSGLEMFLVLNYRHVALERTPLDILNLRRRNLDIDFPVADEENGYFWQTLYEKVNS
ncbi:hypothetical protein KUTeg_020802 [Tegillarca granosa]|uniref:TIR domain-containing protein n=1 Tax=Tegillarca granosa TaxID=220873 RepID=A0ABQ9EEF2_TEGGR|nr:hypothetical protein KUTeg_020802 [Tegillarca granosa]